MIRAASQQDLDVLQQIEDEADSLFIERFRPERWWPAATGQERAAAPGFILVAAPEGGAAVGFVHVIETDIAHLEQLSVRPAMSRRGLGRALVTAAEVEAARRGHRAITLRTYADVPWNAPFYATVDFKESEPATAFHRGLLAVEEDLGLSRYGRRLQMTANLSPAG